MSRDKNVEDFKSMTHSEIEADVRADCNTSAREDLVKSLKSKIHKELQEAKTELWEMLSSVTQPDIVYANNIIDNIIDQLSFLNALEDWVASDRSFCQTYFQSSEYDEVTYVISDYQLSIMLNPKFFFVSNMLYKLQDRHGVDLYEIAIHILTDEYIAYKFISIFEELEFLHAQSESCAMSADVSS